MYNVIYKLIMINHNRFLLVVKKKQFPKNDMRDECFKYHNFNCLKIINYGITG